MTLNAKKRFPSIDILTVDYEYCTISYYAKGERNALGEPARVLVERATNVKCSIDPVSKTPNYVRQSGLRDVLRQGIIERIMYVMTLLADQAIESGDIITDYDGVTYDVLQVVKWQTHKEVYIRKMN